MAYLGFILFLREQLNLILSHLYSYLLKKLWVWNVLCVPVNIVLTDKLSSPLGHFSCHCYLNNVLILDDMKTTHHNCGVESKVLYTHVCNSTPSTYDGGVLKNAQGNLSPHARVEKVFYRKESAFVPTILLVAM